VATRLKPRAAAALLCIVLAAWQFGAWGWIEAKAWLAAGLIEHSWAATLDGAGPVRPWPWADTWPVARLVAPRAGVERLVLHGASGRTLAFGPAWDSASAPPGDPGLVLISGHRDTHFRFLAELRAGDLLHLEHRTGRAVYRIEESSVLDTRIEQIVDRGDDDRLLLVTCWPFGTLAPRGPLRYLVSGRRIDRPGGTVGRDNGSAPPSPRSAEKKQRQQHHAGDEASDMGMEGDPTLARLGSQ